VLTSPRRAACVAAAPTKTVRSSHPGCAAYSFDSASFFWVFIIGLPRLGGMWTIPGSRPLLSAPRGIVTNGP